MKEGLKEILLKFNLTLIEYISSTNILVSDEIGYKYKVNLCNIKNRNKLPHLFRNNPFVIDNIKNYLKINNIGLTLLSDNYIDCRQKLEFICEKHKDKGVQYKTLASITDDKQYCRYCGIEKRGEKYRISDEAIQERCNKLGLIYVDRYVKNQETWVRFKCKIHLNKGIQDISWYHLKDCTVGCAYCTGRYKTTEDFIREMSNINSDIEIIGEYTGSENSVDCRCKICGHKWSPIGRSLRNGQGCPACTSSKGEIRVKHFLDDNKIKYIAQKTFDDCVYKEKLRFDFYLPDYNVLVEYDGEQHFRPVDFASRGMAWANKIFEYNQIKDKIKNDYCKNNNIKLVRIPYWDFNNIDTILASEIY